jgi:hypothetical protein
MPSTPLQAQLAKYALVSTPLSQQDWCSCFSRCPDLLTVSPPVLAERLTKLKSLMGVDDEQLVGSVIKAPSLMQHSPTEIADKVGWVGFKCLCGWAQVVQQQQAPQHAAVCLGAGRPSCDVTVGYNSYAAVTSCGSKGQF